MDTALLWARAERRRRWALSALTLFLSVGAGVVLELEVARRVRGAHVLRAE